MCFKRGLCSIVLLWPTLVLAGSTQLSATPNQCVALEAGRVCYATIKVRWQLEQVASVCLLLNEQPLQCFNTASNSGTFEFEFAANQTQLLQLQVQGKVVSELPLQVSYVQKANKIKRRWRLF